MSAAECSERTRFQQHAQKIGRDDRVWVWVVVSCNRPVGHSGKHHYRWTVPDPQTVHEGQP